MKIKYKISIRYALTTGLLTIVFAVIVYLIAAYDRSSEFYYNLYKEGMSRAMLFLRGEVSSDLMHTTYKNNIEYIDEVEVAIYSSSFDLIYHDASDIDIIKETPEMLSKILESKKSINFKEGRFQAVGFVLNYDNRQYVITAAAYDGYGFQKLHKLIWSLAILCFASIALTFAIGLLFAKRVLKPISIITTKMKDITANNLTLRLSESKENDDIGELAKSFNKSLDIIENSFNEQKMFVSNVSHEIRTPLAIIVGEIDLALLKDREIADYKSTLQSIKLDSKKLITLLNGLLDLAKASYDESEISFNEIRIDEILLDARSFVLKANQDYSINLQFEADMEDLDNFGIKGNEYLLKQGFANLMDNNCKFSPNKSSKVYLGKNNNKLEIKFSDDGEGIPLDEMQYIFKPFFRGRNKSKIKGNGIGLAFVKKVISLHKGTIEVSSNALDGTTFIVCLDSNK